MQESKENLAKIEVREIDKSKEQKKLGEKQGSNPTITEIAASLYPPTAPFAQAVSADEFVAGTAEENIDEAIDYKELEKGGKVDKEIGEIGSLPSITQRDVEKLTGT
ncbi:13973_t:CDS:2 [Dentiscutata heterogama]|uniref:13973_t:CDS:1 n=1 Tax=Dentiscutata heterogama TaxID=1316150 RepID=A0ACA9KBM4_9GLOM|nr:13973_t:CDS:2 [Dentiscutata heterogama]